MSRGREQLREYVLEQIVETISESDPSGSRFEVQITTQADLEMAIATHTHTHTHTQPGSTLEFDNLTLTKLQDQDKRPPPRSATRTTTQTHSTTQPQAQAHCQRQPIKNQSRAIHQSQTNCYSSPPPPQIYPESDPDPDPESNSHSHSHSHPRSTGLHLSHPSVTLSITITLSASLTLLNKSIYTTFNYPYPFHLLALHFASISITSRILARTIRPFELDAYHARVSWSFWFSNIFFVAIAYGSAILCSNLAYLLLTVSFVQMLKAFTPVILVLATAALDRRLPSLRTTLVVLSISSGVAVAAYGELNFVFAGAIWQLLGSLAEVARLIATQRLLQDLRMDPLVALSALSPVCCAMALILAPALEGTQPLLLLLPSLGLPLVIGSVLLALALNIAVLFLVSSTSALVLTLAGILKDICLILGSTFFFNSHVSTTQVLGYSIAALGLVYFKLSGADATANQPGKTGPGGTYVGVPLEEREIDGLERGGRGEEGSSSSASDGEGSEVELVGWHQDGAKSGSRSGQRAGEGAGAGAGEEQEWGERETGLMGRMRRKSAGV